MFWDPNVIWWYFLLLILGIIFFPLTKKLFGSHFYDFGYPFSKTLAIIFLSYTMYVFGTVKILPFSQEALFIITAIFIALNFYIFSKDKKSELKTEFTKKRIFFLVCEELAFFFGLSLWTFIRGQEPSLNSLEKFMDFGFINSILRSKYFPPADMWLAGHSINYYYFGHLTGAVLTKLSAISSAITYNLILATIFALGITQAFSLSFNLIYGFLGKSLKLSLAGGILGSLLVNLGGNLHAIYTFTKGYPNDDPVPFWQILSKYNPQTYWYPNATRFIPYTIHEFPIYSYVVADLHGHVFDIPFVLLTLAVLLILFLKLTLNAKHEIRSTKQIQNKLPINDQLLITIFLGFLTAVHYMTNTFDGPIYLILAVTIFFILFKFSKSFFINVIILFTAFIIFIQPFSLNFIPFATGIGLNCPPEFLTSFKKIGPFLFEKENCQISPFWMLWVLWGFFWMNFIFFISKTIRDKEKIRPGLKFILALFTLSTVFIIIPEVFYIKDIYPGHFRANTMFKLGYQAFIMMGIASSFVFIFYKARLKKNLLTFIYFAVFTLLFFFVMIYPYFAVTSYYGQLKKKPDLDGTRWTLNQYPEYKELIDFLNKNVEGQPTILEAQGDSYTNFNIVSSYTGLPTLSGWYVHEWLWRGKSSIVGDIVPDIVNIYESDDLDLTRSLIRKHEIKYIILGPNERQKYQKIKEEKFKSLGRLIFSSTDGKGKIFSLNTP